MAYRRINISQYERRSKLGKKEFIAKYKQDRPVDRGLPRQVVKAKDTQDTFWLKDEDGHFVGRANIKGKTTAKNFVMARRDKTDVLQEGAPFGRIYGRTKVRGI